MGVNQWKMNISDALPRSGQPAKPPRALERGTSSRPEGLRAQYSPSYSQPRCSPSTVTPALLLRWSPLRLSMSGSSEMLTRKALPQRREAPERWIPLRLSSPWRPRLRPLHRLNRLLWNLCPSRPLPHRYPSPSPCQSRLQSPLPSRLLLLPRHRRLPRLHPHRHRRSGPFMLPEPAARPSWTAVSGPFTTHPTMASRCSSQSTITAAAGHVFQE